MTLSLSQRRVVQQSVDRVSRSQHVDEYSMDRRISEKMTLFFDYNIFPETFLNSFSVMI